MKMGFYFRYAVRSLRRGGQRTLLALLCVAFGVMSLVAMQILAGAISDSLLGDPRANLGGDLSVSKLGAFLSTDDLAMLEAMRESGEIGPYTLVADQMGQLLKLEGSGRTRFVMRATGVDVESYPLTGEVQLRDGGTLAAAISQPMSAAVTRDLAAQYDIKAGDRIALAREFGGAPGWLDVTAVIESTPEREGDKVLYSLETAASLAGRERAVTHALILEPAPAAVEVFQAGGWSATTPAQIVESGENVRAVFDLMLKGAGILGLMVGGIGVANTMQVLLARRTTEIATLKTVGYRQRDLMALFAVETALLGWIGSALGIAAAVTLSRPLVDAFTRIGSMLPVWRADPAILIGGMLIGTLTSAIFGMYAILRASKVRPAVLLRHLPTLNSWRRKFAALGVYALLALPFGILTSAIMGSVLQGAGVIAFALAGLIVLGIGLGLALFVWVRLPIPALPGGDMLKLARNNLKRGASRTLFALIALFTGVFAVGFAVSVIATARSEFAARQASLAGYNLVIHAGGAQADSVRGKLTLESLPAVHERITVPVEALESGGQLLWMRHLQIEGRVDPSWDLTLEGEPWGSIENSVYLPSEMKDRIALGGEITVQMAGGERAALKIAGFYAYKPVESIAERARSPIVSAELARTLSTGESPVIFVAEVPVERLADVTESLAEALPDAMVLSAYEVADALESAIQNLFVFAVAVAGLALVAGAVLIANAVGLAMVERRREIGVLKAVGYGSGDVLAALLMEYGLLGLLAGILGTGGVAVAIQILNILEPRAQLGFDLPSASLVALAAVLVAVISAALAGWGPSHTRPLVVLREE